MHRYGCWQGLLLYPEVPGAAAKNFDIIGPGKESLDKQVAVRFVNLSRNLGKKDEQLKLADELSTILNEHFHPTISCARSPAH